MTYVEIPVTRDDPALSPITELFAAQAIDTPANSALLFCQPSQDQFLLNLSTGVATRLRDGRGPQTASMTWDGTSEGRRTYAAFPKTSGGNLRGGGRQLHTNDPANGADTGRRSILGGELDDIVESRAMAGIAGGAAYLWTATNLYSIARGTAGGDLHVTYIGDHVLGNVTAAAYWPPAQRFIVCANERLWFFDPADSSVEPVLSGTPTGTRGLFVADNRLYAVATDRIARFDSATLRAPTPQQVVERDRWEIRLRSRKHHEILALLTPNEIVEGEFNWRMTTSASGRLQVAATVIDPDLLTEMAYPSEAMGGVDVEFYREHPLGIDQYLGVVGSLDFLRGPTTNVSTLMVGDIINSVWVLGDETSGTGGAECRYIAEVGDDFLIAARGIHQGSPIDAKGATRGVATPQPNLEARGLAEIERQLRKLKVDDDVDFSRSQRIDRINIYLDDPLVYFDRRFSNPGTEVARSYGGVGAGDYLRNMFEQEMQRQPADPDNERYLGLDPTDLMVWVPGARGRVFNVQYPRTRLLKILEEALLVGGLGIRYYIDPDDGQLKITTRAIRDRTSGAERIVLVDGGEAVDPDSVRPGDRVERELIVGNRAISGAARSQLRATVGGCSAGVASRLESDDFSEAGVLVLQRQIRLDGDRGLQVKLSTGDIAQTRADIQRAFIDQNNSARVS